MYRFKRIRRRTFSFWAFFLVQLEEEEGEKKEKQNSFEMKKQIDQHNKLAQQV